MASFEARIVPFNQFTQIYSDEGSDAYLDIQVWHPQTPAGFSSLGDHAESFPKIYGTNPTGLVFVVKDITPDQSALAEPTGFTLVWDTKGSKSKQQGSLWMPTPRPGYVALGYLFNSGFDQPDPSLIKCVRKELVVEVQTGAELWSSQGPSPMEPLMLWLPALKYPARPEGLNVGAFNAIKSYSPGPCLQPFYLLDIAQVTLV